MTFIPYGRQDISEEDVEAVIAVLRSDWLTQGPAVERFEAAVASRCGARHAVAVSSGTAALHVACLALGLGPGDWLWTSPNTFVASANCGLYCGASVDFVDIDPHTWNIDPVALADRLVAAERDGRLPKVLVAVHFAGQPCDMQAIGALAERYRFKVIEDASHALGARYRDAAVGACRYADISVFSFHPVKIITTGEGGMLTTNDADLAVRLRELRSHGITRDPERMGHGDQGPWYYEQIALGFNYRITDLQCALGLSQLDRLDAFVDRRRALAARYDALLGDLPLQLPHLAEGAESAWHLYVVLLSAEDAGRRREVFERLRAAGIGVNVHYIPVHLQPWYRERGFNDGDFPRAEDYYARAISLPLFPGLAEVDQDRVVAELRAALA